MPERSPPCLIARARLLRQTMTGPERKIWEKLRAHRMLGAHFKRQVPVGPYVADFMCHAARLVIELDGDQHGFPDRLAADKRRDGFLISQGYRILRFSNWQVMNEFERVLLTIEHVVGGGTPPNPPPKGRAKVVSGTTI